MKTTNIILKSKNMNPIIVHKIELANLKEKVLQEAIKDWEYNSCMNPRRMNQLDIMVDVEESWIFWCKGSINADYDEAGNFQIYEFCIGEHGLQFPDFEGTLKPEYISSIEKYVTE